MTFREWVSTFAVGSEPGGPSWSAGSAIEDLPGIYREEFPYAAEVARARYDPCLEWVEFRDTLWNYLIRVFGLEADDVPV